MHTLPLPIVHIHTTNKEKLPATKKRIFFGKILHLVNPSHQKYTGKTATSFFGLKMTTRPHYKNFQKKTSFLVTGGSSYCTLCSLLLELMSVGCTVLVFTCLFVVKANNKPRLSCSCSSLVSLVSNKPLAD